MQSQATTVEQYIAELPEDRRAAIAAVRKVILKPRRGLRGGHAVRHDRVLRPAPHLPGRLSLRSQVAVAVRGSGVAEELHVAVSHFRIWLYERSELASNGVGQDRQETRHGQVLHPFQKAGGSVSRRHRRGHPSPDREEVHRAIRVAAPELTPEADHENGEGTTSNKARCRDKRSACEASQNVARTTPSVLIERQTGVSVPPTNRCSRTTRRACLVRF